MFRLNVRPLAGVLVLLLLVGIVSCVDNRYGLDRDIDMTISVGGDYLSIPGGSTDTTYLSKIITEGDLLVTDAATHEYQLARRGLVNVEPTSVGTFDIGEISSSGFHPVVIVGGGSAVGRGSVEKEVDMQGSFSQTVFGIDEALMEVGDVGAGVPAKLSIAFAFSGSLNYQSVIARNLHVELPYFFVVRACDETKGELRGNTLVLDGVVLSSGNNDSFATVLEVDGYKFGDAAGNGKKVDKANSSIEIDGEVNVSGSVITVFDGNLDANTSLSFAPSVVLDAMTVNKVTGIIQPTIEVEPTNIGLDDIPDFLKDDATRLEVTNPVVAFGTENKLDTPVEFDVTLVSHRNGETAPLATVTVDDIEIDAGCITAIILSRLGKSGYADAEHVKNVKVEDINNLWERIPDYITVDISPSVTNPNYYTVELDREYDMLAGYDVVIPLSFESGLNIVYNDSICDLNADFSDLDQVDFDQVGLQFTAVSTIPLQLELKPENVVVKDIYGQQIESIKVTADGRKIAESTDGTTPVESRFAVVFTSAEAGVLSRVDRICFKVTAVPGQALNVPLRDNQWIRMSKINLNVPGGVKVDLN